VTKRVEADESDGRLVLRIVGFIRSTVRSIRDAPRQGAEGAPDAWLEVESAFARALHRVAPGDELWVITWLHQAERDVLEVHPRDDPTAPLTGVFRTRSQHRPNPLGLHRVTVRDVDGARLRVGPIEALDGTPVVDVKVVIGSGSDVR
jgi:tRNA-Thr(GGU) m(6)t(6)A37 methyltransferase TsaA